MEQDVAALVPDMVRALTIGWKNLGSYPAGHPALAGAMESVQQKLDPLTTATGELTLGISRDALFFGEQKYDFTQAQKFANALYLRDVALIRIARGITAGELDAFLRTLTPDPSRAQRPLWDELTDAGVEHIQLQPVDYSSVRVTDGLDALPEKQPASLWESILQALLSGKQLSAEGERALGAQQSDANIAELLAQFLSRPRQESDAPGEARSAESGDTMKTALLESGAAGTFDDTISRHMKSVRPLASSPSATVAAAVSQYLSRTEGANRTIAAHQVTELFRALPPEMREMVLTAAIRALVRDESAAEALQVLCTSLPADAVLQALRKVTSEGLVLSRHALKLAQALSAMTKERPVEPNDTSGVDAIAAELAALLKDEDIDRFNPEEHQEVLGEISLQFPEVSEKTDFSAPELDSRLDSVSEGALTDSLASTLLELIADHARTGSIAGPLRLSNGVFQFYLRSRQLGQALAVVESIASMGGKVTPGSPQQQEIHSFFSGLVSDEAISSLIETQGETPEEQEIVRKLMQALGASAAKNFLLALAGEENRSRRRKLFNLVSSLGPLIIPEAKRLLSDERWFVVRNMLVLLRSVGDRTSVNEVRACAHHPDLRVRLEAIKSLLAFDPNVPYGLLEKAIHDPDPKLAEAAVALVGSYGIREGVEPILSILDRWDLFGRHRSLRLKSLRALSDLGDASALPRLGRFFRESFIPIVAKDERRAAYKFLEGYPPEARRELVEKGLRARDPEIRDTCVKLSRIEKQDTFRGDDTMRGTRAG